MDGPSKTPAFNLKVVIRETGLKPDTLRAWERRYGLPNPRRSSGGHRLYSQYDIETIKWLIERQNEGLRINRAVQLWQSFEEQGQDHRDPEAMACNPVAANDRMAEDVEEDPASEDDQHPAHDLGVLDQFPHRGDGQCASAVDQPLAVQPGEDRTSQFLEVRRVGDPLEPLLGEEEYEQSDREG